MLSLSVGLWGEKIMIARLFAMITLWAATTGAAFAVFSAPPGPVPEPTTAALIMAGALVVGGARYLSKRKRDK